MKNTFANNISMCPVTGKPCSEAVVTNRRSFQHPDIKRLAARLEIDLMVSPYARLAALIGNGTEKTNFSAIVSWVHRNFDLVRDLPFEEQIRVLAEQLREHLSSRLY